MIGHKETWFCGPFFFFDKMGTLPAHHNCCSFSLCLKAGGPALHAFSELKHIADWLHFASIEVRKPEPAGTVRAPCTGGKSFSGRVTWPSLALTTGLGVK